MGGRETAGAGSKRKPFNDANKTNLFSRKFTYFQNCFTGNHDVVTLLALFFQLFTLFPRLFAIKTTIFAKSGCLAPAPLKTLRIPLWSHFSGKIQIPHRQHASAYTFPIVFLGILYFQNIFLAKITSTLAATSEPKTLLIKLFLRHRRLSLTHHFERSKMADWGCFPCRAKRAKNEYLKSK